ncbi:MAG: hypothetical protein LBP41_01760 [Holosporaceae bacterium]|jgi:hypothetical protein|nr:hypothetical protein [Holosporaceae bacterium]
MKKALKLYAIALCAAGLSTPEAYSDSYGSSADDSQEQGNAASEDVESHAILDSLAHFYAGIGASIASHRAKNEYTYGAQYADGVAVTPHIIGKTDKELDGAVTKFNGVFILGVGTKMQSNPFYVSVEAGVDLGPQAKHSSYGAFIAGGARRGDTEISHKSYNPWFALRVGGVWKSILVYIKGGGKYSKIEEHYTEYDVNTARKIVTDSVNKISAVIPIVAIGIEKYFAKNASFRVEAGYGFGKNGTKNFGAKGSTKLTLKDVCTIRALICWNLGAGKRL